MSDLEPQFKLERDQISLEEMPSNLIGKGGYAEVYKACHKGKVMGRGTWGGGAEGDTRMTQRERVMGDTEGGDTGEGTHGEGSV